MLRNFSSEGPSSTFGYAIDYWEKAPLKKLIRMKLIHNFCLKNDSIDYYKLKYYLFN